MAPRPPNNVHTLDQRLFIVRRLAAFEPPRAIVAAFCALFPDTACNENDVLANDPTTAIVPPELFAAFKAERERILLDPGSDPFTDQKARLILLSNHVRFHNANNELATARGVLNQIAAELGVIGAGAGKAAKGKDADENTTPEFKKIEVTRTVVEPTMEPEVTE